MAIIKKMWAGLVDLIYPPLCLACNEELPPAGLKICLSCRMELEYTEHHLHRYNAFTERLAGRVPLKAAASLFIYRKKSRVQSLLHEIKYNGNHALATELGMEHGKRMAESGLFDDIEFIVPVPLYPRKKRIRGFNQSAKYAAGLSAKMGVPYSDNVLVRRRFTETQTKKGMEARFDNVENVFELARPHVLRQKHVLIVDDVMTTGATLEACANAILSKVDVRLSFATLALALH